MLEQCYEIEQEWVGVVDFLLWEMDAFNRPLDWQKAYDYFADQSWKLIPNNVDAAKIYYSSAVKKHRRALRLLDAYIENIPNRDTKEKELGYAELKLHVIRTEVVASCWGDALEKMTGEDCEFTL